MRFEKVISFYKNDHSIKKSFIVTVKISNNFIIDYILGLDFSSILSSNNFPISAPIIKTAAV